MQVGSNSINIALKKNIVYECFRFLPLFFFPCSVDEVVAAEILAVFDDADVAVFDADGTSTGMAGRFRGIDPVIK